MPPAGAVSSRSGSRGSAGQARSGQPAAGARSSGAGRPADVPPAAALDAISLTGDEEAVTAPQTAESVVGSAGAGVPGTPGAGNPAWPVSRRPRRQPGADDPAPASVASNSIPPGARSAAARGRVASDLFESAPDGARPSEADANATGAPPLFLQDASRSVLTWARRRYLGLSSATGISVALAACAAAWFSAGTTADMVRGVAALWGGYLVLVAGRSLATKAASATADRRAGGPVRWLAALGGSVAEAAIYAGLAVAAAAQRYPGTWALAIGVIGLVAVRNVMTASSTPYGLVHPPETLAGRVWAGAVTMAPGGRILVVGLVAPFWGARTVLLVLLAWAISSVGYGLAGRAVHDVGPEAYGHDSATMSASLVRLRDDGLLARYLGTLVRGILLPLPPAILGLAAVITVAVVGLRGLPGLLLMAPAIVMLLAAPGSANPHLGRFDWLVPVLLLSSQILYIAAVGAGGRVPGPVVFGLAAVLLVRYTDLACAQRPVLLVKPRRRDGAPREYGTELGWEGRLLFVGLAAALGAATAGYLALTAYLVLLVGVKVVRSCIIAADEDLA